MAGDELETITITAEELPEVGEVELSEFTGSADHITRDQLDREQNSIAELVAQETGIQFRQAGGSGSFATITVRAATASQTNVYFDGVLLNNAATGGVDLSQFELLNLESIDVYRGSTPIQLGAGSIGGAVNLRSRKTKGNATGLLLGAGSFGEYKAQLSRYIRTDDWDLTALANYVSADNDFKFTNDNGTPLNPSDDRVERRNNSDFSRRSVLLKAGRQVTDLQRYDGSLQYSDRRQALPDFLNREDTRTRLDTDSFQLQLNRRTTASSSGVWNHTEGLFFNRSNERFDDRLSQIGLGAQNTRAITNVVGGRSYWEAVRENGTLAFNLAARHEALDQNSFIDSDADFSATRTGADGAVQYSVFRYERRLVLTPALRFQFIADDYDGVLREGRDSRNNLEITPQLGARWQHSDAVAITANIGLHNREPVFFELFGDRGLFIGNDSLVAEEGVNFDLGAQWSKGSDALANRRSFSITAFASLRDELIVSVFDSRGIGRSVNSGKARVFGIESKLEWQWNKHWRTRLGFTAQTATNESSVAAFNGKQLPGEAQLAGFASLQYQRGAWRAWYDADALSERFFDTANLLPADDFITHNLGGSYTRKKFSTTLVLNNLGDDNIEDFNGFPKPGRSFHLNVTYTFDGVAK